MIEKSQHWWSDSLEYTFLPESSSHVQCLLLKRNYSVHCSLKSVIYSHFFSVCTLTTSLQEQLQNGVL